MKRLWWVRHAPTHAKDFVGWTDRPADCSDAAWFQRTSAILPSGGACYASDLVRCTQTAAQLGFDPTTDPRLREFNFGLWEAQDFETVSKTDPELSRAYWENPGDVAPPSGESWNQGAARMHQAVDDLIRAAQTDDIVIVAHFGVILTQLQRALECSAHAALRFKIDPLSVTRIDYLDGSWRVCGVNNLV